MGSFTAEMLEPESNSVHAIIPKGNSSDESHLVWHLPYIGI